MRVRLGDPIIYVDPYGVKRGAILSTIWGGANAERDAKNNIIAADVDGQAVNLVFTSGDPDRVDNGGNGRQIERESSVTHVSRTDVHGRYWRCVQEAGKETERES